jgi:hypothetical protein
VVGRAASASNAGLTREVAEIAMTEYLEGIYPENAKRVEGELALANSDALLARQCLEEPEQAANNSRDAAARRSYKETAVRLADQRHQRAQDKKAELDGRKRERMVNDLKSEVERARADELTKKAAYDRLAAMASPY